MSLHLVQPDLLVDRESGSDLLGKLRRVGDLTLVEMLVLGRAAEAVDHAVGCDRSAAREDVLEAAADVLPTRRLATDQHA